MRVTASSHPATFECLEAVSHDMGASAGHASYVVADSWVGKLAIAEGALAGLSREDRETLSIGDAGEARVIHERSPGLKVAYDLLLGFFNDWIDWR